MSKIKRYEITNGCEIRYGASDNYDEAVIIAHNASEDVGICGLYDNKFGMCKIFSKSLPLTDWITFDEANIWLFDDEDEEEYEDDEWEDDEDEDEDDFDLEEEYQNLLNELTLEDFFKLLMED